MKYLLYLTLVIVTSLRAFSAPGDVEIMQRNALGGNEIKTLPATADQFIGFDSFGELTVKPGGSIGGLSRAAWTTAVTTLLNNTEHVGPIAADWECAALPAASDSNTTQLKVLADGTDRNVDFHTNVTVYRLGGGEVTEDYTVPANTSAHFVLEYNNSRWEIIDIIIDDEAANTLYAGPASGGDDIPTFRAMVAADIPNDLLDSQHYAAASIDGEHLSADARGTFIETLSADHTLSFDPATGEGCGSIHYVTAACDIQFPDAPTRATWTIIVDGVVTVSLVPDPAATADTLKLDGTALTAGNEVDSTGVTGDVAVVSYRAADTLFVSSNSWVDGGAAD